MENFEQEELEKAREKELEAAREKELKELEAAREKERKKLEKMQQLEQLQQKKKAIELDRIRAKEESERVERENKEELDRIELAARKAAMSTDDDDDEDYDPFKPPEQFTRLSMLLLERITAGFDALLDYINANDLRNDFDDFIDYFRFRTWFRRYLKEHWCVNDRDRRTNNHIEYIQNHGLF